MGTDTDDFGESAFLGALDPEAREGLLRRARRREFKSGATIFMRDDPGDTLYLIEEGRVEISLTSFGGKRSVLNHMGPGEILGEIALLDNGVRSADASAATRVVLKGLSRHDITRFLAEHPEANMALISGLCARVREAVEMFELQSRSNARTRVARCLVIIAGKWGKEEASGDIRIDVPLSQADLGELSGLARENVNRQIKSMTSEGLLRLDGRTIVITDLEGLEDLAEE